jgi:ppGpp synthetase/RelA/SpoT-type nucleotidyltranferase
MSSAETAGDERPFSTSAINRIGDRLRKAAAAGAGFREDDLDALDRFRLWHQPTLEQIQREVVETFHQRGGIDEEALPITGRPLKTQEAIIAKLVRSKTRLATMQDIAGTRITVPGLELQRLITDVVGAAFADRNARIERDTVETGDEYGYRAIHVVVTLDGRHAEIQIRTRAQDAWAQLVENLDRAQGWDLKHGRGPEEWVEWLIRLSDALRERELGRPAQLPPSPYDELMEVQEGMEE